jgi:4-amino-4-deoxy-L-arabinose transferase-like glycosyltransferase
MFALLLRLLMLGQQNLWHDEHMSLKVAAVPLEQMPELLRTLESNKPPLYFALLHYWLHFGTGEFWLRLPSAIIGSLGCVLAAAIGRQFFGVRHGVWVGCLVAVSPFHIYYSQEARPFALWGFFVGGALLLQLKFCTRPRLGLLIGYVLLAVLACYTFTYAFFIVGFSMLFGLAFRPALPKHRLVQIGVANASVLLFFLPWLWRVLASVSGGVGLQVHHRAPAHEAAAYSFLSLGLGTSFGPPLEALRLLGRRVFQEAPGAAGLLIVGAVLVAFFVGTGLARLWRFHRNAFYFSVIGLLVFWGTPAVLNLLNPSIPYNPRYAFPAVIPLMLPVCAALQGAILQKSGWQCGVSGLFLFAVGFSLRNQFFNPDYARDDLRAAARFLREMQPPPDQIIVCAGTLSEVFRHYYGPNGTVHPVMVESPASVNELLAGITASPAAAPSLALVYSRPDHGDPERILPGALENEHRLLDKRHWTGVDVYVFAGAR